MLAASQPRDYSTERFYEELRFPVIATPKLDGIRCITHNVGLPEPGGLSVPVCRSLKSVPNDHIRWTIGTLPPGLDGEIMTYDETRDLFHAATTRPKSFHGIQSDVMSHAGKPLFKYWVFDAEIFHQNPDHPYSVHPYRERLNDLEFMDLPDFVVKVPSVRCNNVQELCAYESQCVANGYEGICFRTPSSPYKHGRSTFSEQWLVKMKRFVTEEAVIIGLEEEMANNNPASLSETGYAERSSHKANMAGKGRMGALVVKNDQGTFKIGTGFDAAQRAMIWANQADYIGKIAQFKHQPHGSKDLPRIPVFVGFRDGRDL
jgi:DNA ligase-1